MKSRQRYRKTNAIQSRTGRKRKSALLAIGLILGAVLVAVSYFAVDNVLGKSDFFQITTIRITGCEQVNKSLVLEKSEVDIHSNLFSLDTDAVRVRVESMDWIQQAEVDKHWPSRLDISVKEHSPVAMVNIQGTLHFVDKSGNIFAETSPLNEMDYPVITGLSGTEPESLYESRELLEALRFVKYASRGNLNLPAQNISEINVTNIDEAVLFLVDQPFPIYLGSLGKGLKTKYYRLARILSWLYRKKKFAHTEYINTGYMSDRIVVGLKAL